MTSPIGKLSPAAFPVTLPQPRTRAEGAAVRPDAGAAPPGDPNLELLEVVAGQVSESTGEACEASPSTSTGETDPSYRMELIGFIVGSLARAAQAARSLAPPPAEVEAEDEEAPPPEVEAALPEEALAEEPAQEPVEPKAAPEPDAPSGYGHDGHPREGGKAEGKLTRWV